MTNTIIRPAVKSDQLFISDLMDHALAPYYDGDHRAHAARILDSHLEGADRFGHFSKEQVMFILEDTGEPVAMVNIVGKRQGTWKISPLIVSPGAQGKGGHGSQLLEYVENHAREHGARQMYATVASENKGALNFFLRKGYTCAGEFESHYKPGVTEVMIYKIFFTDAEAEQFDREHLSVMSFDEGLHGEEVTKLILEQLPQHFECVDQSWVDALFAGYARRATGEVNTKYKLIFVVTDRKGVVHGVAGVTPKKGEPIKIMPCVAKSAPAFAALITDLPQLLREYGRKLYTHLVPGVSETIILQQMGWQLAAVMPAAYHPNLCTQQWGVTLEDIPMRNMRVKSHFLNHIMAGRKPLEVRVGYANLQGIKAGEKIQLASGTKTGVIKVMNVRRYKTFKEMLDVERYDHILPGAASKDAVLDLLQEIYPTEKEKLGVLVFEIEPDKN